MVAPDPSGEDTAAVMNEALRDAQLQPSEVDYINAHGTATKANDLCESKAIGLVFGAGEKGPYVSSTKSQIGHTIGAAGALGAIAAILSIKNDVIPPNINCDEVDAECNINVARKLIHTKVRNAIVNAFGFGSNNAAILFGKTNK